MGNLDVDPQGLERAAKALRDLNSQPNARLAIQQTIKQEESSTARSKVRLKDKEIEKEKVIGEENRKTQDKQMEMHKRKMNYNDDLDKKRYVYKLEQQEKMAAENRSNNEASVQKQEDIKRKTIDYEMDRQSQLEEKKQILKAQSKARIQRENQDLIKDQIVLREQERRQTIKESLALGLGTLGNGMSYLLSHKRHVAGLMVYTFGLYAGYFLARRGVGLGIRLLESKLRRPSLVRKTSRLTLNNLSQAPQILMHRLKPASPASVFDDLVLSPSVEAELQVLAQGIVRRRENNAPLRNILVYGPPGTGKTLFAQNLATMCGMDYALFTGGDVGACGRQGLTQINKIFDFAEASSSRGMLLFIDEADAFFRDRDGGKMSEGLRNSINAFLHRSGTPSRKVLFVAATNMPHQLDSALLSRVDQCINFPLPEQPQREQLLYLFFSKYCKAQKMGMLDVSWNIHGLKQLLFPVKQVTVDFASLDEDCLSVIARQLEGFSAREIEKFVVQCHDIAFTTEEALVNRSVLDRGIGLQLRQHQDVMAWQTMMRGNVMP